jgi:predicted aspartyl protease
MNGVVTAAREAIVRLRLYGSQGLDTDVDAVLDTGFTEYLTLPLSWITMLALPYLFTDHVTLADGSMVPVDLYEGIINWNGQDRAVTVHCLEGTPLIGMALLFDHLLTAQVIDGGLVTIAPFP